MIRAPKLAVLALSATAIIGCNKPDDARTPTSDDLGGVDTGPTAPNASSPRVVFGNQTTAYVEVARTQSKIRRGLMYRTHMPADAGMLFLFDKEKVQSFWMKNTLISLDIIFIGADMTVAGVKAKTTPRTLASQRIGTPSQYVLEVNAGWAGKNGIEAGTAVRFLNVENVPPGKAMVKSSAP